MIRLRVARAVVVSAALLVSGAVGALAASTWYRIDHWRTR